MAGEGGAEDLESRVDSRSRPAGTAARTEREEPLRSLQSRAASYLRGITPGTPGSCLVTPVDVASAFRLGCGCRQAQTS